ncbi:uncharacterized protein LOC122395352 [Colletes gigas]|uniref:uncharacterized protein LOC122395352 n=1 Tax=Colletes gigas TaxID=935657 RepID=UPI001C9A3084|nr:uncharacterized protein LOC122395352 [Colletes gigas]
MFRMDGVRALPSISMVLLFCFSSFTHGSHGTAFPDDFDRKIETLYKVVDYVYRRPHQMNADVTLSITIVEANTASMFSHKNKKYLGDERYRKMRSIFNRCVAIRKYLRRNVVPKTKDMQVLHESLSRLGLWLRHICWQNGTLKKKSPTPGFTEQDVLDLVMQGTPKEEESDRCLAKIVRNKLNSINGMPETCVEILERDDRVRGYPLVHRLFIIQVAMATGVAVNVPCDLLVLYCSAILQDLVDIEAAGFPFNTPDLMMEQALLCGMEGFLEFTGKRYERLLMSFPHPNGCFSSFSLIVGNLFAKNRFPDNLSPHIVRRTSSKTDFDCDSHTTGLAAALLSLFIRENMENLLL